MVEVRHDDEAPRDAQQLADQALTLLRTGEVVAEARAHDAVDALVLERDVERRRGHEPAWCRGDGFRLGVPDLPDRGVGLDQEVGVGGHAVAQASAATREIQEDLRPPLAGEQSIDDLEFALRAQSLEELLLVLRVVASARPSASYCVWYSWLDSFSSSSPQVSAVPKRANWKIPPLSE